MTQETKVTRDRPMQNDVIITRKRDGLFAHHPNGTITPLSWFDELRHRVTGWKPFPATEPVKGLSFKKADHAAKVCPAYEASHDQ